MKCFWAIQLCTTPFGAPMNKKGWLSVYFISMATITINKFDLIKENMQGLQVSYLKFIYFIFLYKDSVYQGFDLKWYGWIKKDIYKP